MSPAPRRYALAVRTPPASSDAIAVLTGLHPDLVRRLVALGAAGAPYADDAPGAREVAARLVRVVRLRRDLGLNYAGALLAVDLLSRIDELEARLGAQAPHER